MPNRPNKKRTAATLGVVALGASVLPVAASVSNAAYVDRERIFDNRVTSGGGLDLVVHQPSSATINGNAVPDGYQIDWDGVTAGQNSDTNTTGRFRVNAPNIAPGDVLRIPLSPANVGDFPMTYTLDVCSVVDSTPLFNLDGIDDGDSSDFAGTNSNTTANLGVIATIFDAGGNMLGTTDGGGNCSFDAGRFLGANATEDLTVELVFPLTMTNASVGATVDVDLTFRAKQFSANRSLESATIIAPSRADKLAMGHSHTCEIRNGGEVWCWGRDHYGQLGNRWDGDSTIAARAGGISDAVRVEAGMHSMFAVTSTGDLWTWGRNDHGQLGLGSTSTQQYPRKVNISNVKKVSAGIAWGHSVILLEDGTVKVAGKGDRIGLGGNESHTYVAPSKKFNKVRDVSASNVNVYVLDNDGVWGTGGQGYNALASYTGTDDNFTNDWLRIGSHADVNMLFDGRDFGGAYQHTNGEVWAWGRDGYGQLGLGTTASSRPITRLPHLDGSKEIAFGGEHTIALKHDGTAWGTGHNNYGQLGVGDYTDRYSLERLTTLSGVDAVQAGWYSSSAITTTSRYAWGRNDRGQIGEGNVGHKNTPQLIQ